MSENAKILILQFGSQYTNLIVRRCREFGISYVCLPYNEPLENLKKLNSLQGVILSGSPFSVYDNEAPLLSYAVWSYFLEEIKVPVLGICYGMQLIAYQFEGTVEPADIKAFGPATITVCEDDKLFIKNSRTLNVWMSHSDCVKTVGKDFKIIARSAHNGIAALSNASKKLWGVQFHPEVSSTPDAKRVFQAFFFYICHISVPSMPLERYIHETIENIREEVKNCHVIGAVSGGVDSLVAAKLVQKAVGDQLHAIFVDTGLLREGDAQHIRERLERDLVGSHLICIDASEQFLSNLRGVIDPEEKRKIIGKTFIEVFMDVHANLEKDYPPGTFDNAFLLQGTVFPDVIESMASDELSHKIKTHHNVGGLPEKLHYRLLEPLREFFKDEVRDWGIELGLPKDAVYRHPFPGPGLAIRIISDVTKEKLDILRKADKIYVDEIFEAGLYYNISQAFAVLLPDCFTVGVAGDQRLYGMTVGLRALTTSDYMTAHAYRLPHDILEKCSTRIMNEVPFINRVVYDISSKPPATIEWE